MIKSLGYGSRQPHVGYPKEASMVSMCRTDHATLESLQCSGFRVTSARMATDPELS